MEIYKDTSYSFEERAADLVSRMTLEEKISRLSNNSAPIPRLGVGFYNVAGEASHGFFGTHRGKRLTATSFPVCLALSQSWDPDLIYAVTTVISNEVRAYGNEDDNEMHLWCPTVNIARDPRNGRSDENFGEDPYLAGQLVTAYVQGLQGPHDRYLKTISTPKHFAMNSSEDNRHFGSSYADEATLREYYAKPFEAAVRQGNAQSIMTSYNRVNGIPSSCNPYLLDTLLREEWGFDGFVVSDCGAVIDIMGLLWDRQGQRRPGHLYVKTREEASALSLITGTDMSCGSEHHFNLKKALELGYIKESVLDRALIRIFTSFMRLGIFDPPEMNPYRKIDRSVVCAPAHTALAEAAAEESLVLLKNDKGLLPLNKERLGKVLVVGPNALYRELGGYSAGDGNRCVETQLNIMTLEGIRRVLEGSGVEVAYEKGWCSGREAYIAQARERAAQPVTDQDMRNVRISDGEHFTEEMYRTLFRSPLAFVPEDPDVGVDDAVLMERALAAAKTADAVIVVAGTDITTGAEELDRLDLSLPYGQDAKIRQLLAANPNTVVVLVAMGAVTGDFFEEAPAVVNACFAGQTQGLAIARLLFGEFSPSGRLSATWYRSAADLPAVNDYGLKPTDTLDGKGRTYMYHQGPVLFPFGHGLSYVDWDYRDLKLLSDLDIPASPGRFAREFTDLTVDADDRLLVRLRLSNEGEMEATEVVQLYLSKCTEGDAVDVKPIRALKGFARVSLPAGISRTVEMEMPISELAFWNHRTRRMEVEEGRYKVEVGRSSADIRLTGEIEVTGAWHAPLCTVYVTAPYQVCGVGVSQSLTVTATREDSSRVTLSRENTSFASTVESVLTVDEEGKVTAVAPGAASVVVTVEDDGYVTERELAFAVVE